MALALEALILLLLLTLGETYARREESGPALATFDTRPAAEAPAEEPEQEPSAAADSRPAPAQPQEAEPVVAEAQPSALPLPVPRPQPRPLVLVAPPPQQAAPAEAAPARPRVVMGPMQGPPAGPQDRAGSTDSAVVGTAPDGSPLYAAAWYRKPYDDELRGYLSTAQGPGWGLIACRTVPEWRVEDCVALEESPPGSNIARSVLAAAWQFRVRPPRVGGEFLVGSWVRIRIDYERQPR